MKILNVVNIYFTLPYFLGDQLRFFANKGYNEYVSCSPAPQLPEFAEKQNCKFKEIPFSRKFEIRKDCYSLWQLLKYIRQNKFDVVCGHTPKAGMLAMVAARILGVKKRIFFRHGLVYETASGLKRKILVFSERLASMLATKVVCVSPYLLEKSIEDNLTKQKKLTILNHGSSTGLNTSNIFNRKTIENDKLTNLKKDLGLNSNNFVIGFVGRMVKDKGIIELIDAFKNLKKRHSNVRLLLLGPLEDRDGLPAEIINYIHQDPYIIHTGLVEKNMQYYYSCMDVLVLPTHREGLGMALLEAQAMEVPVMAPSHTGSKDAFLANQTGLYIDLKPQSIEHGVEMYIKNPDLKKQHGEAGRKFVENNFNQAVIWNEIENLYLSKDSL